MALKTLLRVTALAEGGMALACLVVPHLPVDLLFGQPPATPLALVLARFVGAVLLSLSLASWLVAKEPGAAALGVVKALLFYDVMAIVVFLYSRLALGLAGILLWPAVVVHVILGAWCFLELCRD